MSRTNKPELCHVRQKTRTLKTAREAAEKLGKLVVKAEAKLHAETSMADSECDVDSGRGPVGSAFENRKTKMLEIKSIEAAACLFSAMTEGDAAWCGAITAAKAAMPIRHKAKYDQLTGRHTGEKNTNCVVRGVLRNLYEVNKHQKLTDKASNEDEKRQLLLIYNAVDKHHRSLAGLKGRYDPGKNRLLDAKVLQAAILQIATLTQRVVAEQQASKTQRSAKVVAPTVKIEEVESVPTLTSADDASTVSNTLEQTSAKSSFAVDVSGNDPASIPSVAMTPVRSDNLSFSRPFSIYATTPASPFAALHKVQSGRLTKDIFKPSNAAIFSNSPIWRARAIDSNRSPSLSPTPSLISTSSLDLPSDSSTFARKPKQIDFGNRVEQALLKIEKWADGWLSGTFNGSNQDLAWESFEFCLRMSDVLDHVQENRAPQIKTEL